MNSPHLDDEALSAHLDEPPGPDATAPAHIDGCRQCRSRLDALHAVRLALAAPVPGPGNDERDRAIAAAMSAWDQARAGGDEEVAAGPAGAITTIDAGRRRRSRVLVAAAVVAALVAAPLVVLGGGDRNTTETAGMADRGSGVEVAERDGGDLGELSDPTELGRAVRGALPGAVSEEALASPSPSPAGAGTEAQPHVTGTEVQPNVAGDGQRAAARPPPGEAQDAAGTTLRRRAVNPPCAAATRVAYGRGMGDLVYSALLEWQGTPAVALAYRLANPGSPGLDYRLFVVARRDCQLLVVQSL